MGFTSMSKHVSARHVMMLLNELFSKFDELVDKHRVHKVETGERASGYRAEGKAGLGGRRGWEGR